ncbi:unnamed protein product [Caenorhabditis auriculariae]|uniref:Uncharacterized protein n=1 Tax=Caenorhabditis auriculariae TaxID=2777116 RepID=A0A8S1H5Q5_9PELO|nr:unnamed protein product [Caenorhabditis auriculariae]
MPGQTSTQTYRQRRNHFGFTMQTAVMCSLAPSLHSTKLNQNMRSSSSSSPYAFVPLRFNQAMWKRMTKPKNRIPDQLPEQVWPSRDIKNLFNKIKESIDTLPSKENQTKERNTRPTPRTSPIKQKNSNRDKSGQAARRALLSGRLHHQTGSLTFPLNFHSPFAHLVSEPPTGQTNFEAARGPVYAYVRMCVCATQKVDVGPVFLAAKGHLNDVPRTTYTHTHTHTSTPKVLLHVIDQPPLGVLLELLTLDFLNYPCIPHEERSFLRSPASLSSIWDD